ncbi:hypothetical protein [Mucilaginibacter sp.]|jgi:hypothetical protein|uniref:hypothetical protein n=1 Tax=Mucilaginibacter sp. TaxID=1882438 RepID=UPI0035624FDD
MSKFNKLSRAEMKNVLGGLVDPGGNNGNPCPTLCEPMGGSIYCTGINNGTIYLYEGNCNTVPHSGQLGLHNYCSNDTTGGFWC